MLQTIFVLIGTFVGAGFASGKEVFNFFTRYGKESFFSILLFSFLLFWLVWKCFRLKISLSCDNYRDFILYLAKKYPFFNEEIFLFVVNLFLATSFYLMVVALSSLFFYQLQIAKWITIMATISICFFILNQKNLQYIYRINFVLMPLFLLWMFIIGVKNIDFSFMGELMPSTSTCWLAIGKGLLYFSYNSLLLIPIIFDLDLSKIKQQLCKTSVLYAFLICTITLLINLLLLQFSSSIETLDLPLLYIAHQYGRIVTFFYFFIFLSAIFTTMLSAGFSFVHNFRQAHFMEKLFLFLILSFLFSVFSFSSLIDFFYPLFGILGFLQIFLLFRYKT